MCCRDALHVMLALTLVDMIGVGLVIPSLPALAQDLGLDNTRYGLMGAAYGLGQLIGGPMCGALSDGLGRRHVLLLSFAGSMVFYGLLGLAWSLPVLLVCRFGVGLVKQTMTMSTAYITDISGPSTRTRSLAWNSVAVGIGFMLGPMTGSILARRVDIRSPFYLSAAIFALNLLLGLLVLPDSRDVANAKHAKAVEAPHSIKDGQTVDDCPAMRTTQIDGGVWPHLRNAWWTLQALRRDRPAVLRLVAIRFVANACLIVLESTMLVFLQQRFQVDRKSNGFFLGGVGLVGVLTNWLVVGRIARRLGELRALVVAFAIGAVSTLCAGLAPTFLTFLAAMSGLTLAHNLNRTCLLALYSKLIPLEQRGTYLGMSDSLDASSRVLLPVVGGALMDVWPALPFCASAAAQLGLLLVWTSSMLHEQTLVEVAMPGGQGAEPVAAAVLHASKAEPKKQK